ncbi:MULTISPECIES: MerR family transcriptional regulator [unclassified Amycolatopsis]|uniref:MerR family transcriptional regulator n=1 Tax=unclassified Amycolatopsis TaxID=2618356 RepID=UPI002E15862E|nr:MULTISPECIES: MerR family transcriptional regulator [unclassified Amycolatopsis]WSJ78160.1 MerR family transcriptional regulator [Amycolatopsis sp. NBC_01307]WSK78279.1 MerR family transcriptional regulator [Amycolatopsis sp. NBC_01286]
MTDTSEARSLGSSEVARTLGVSQVTLRTWEKRYGIGAAQREDNNRRRYTPEDVERLRRMRALQAQGTSARDAARLVLSRSAAETTVRRRRERLAEAAESFDLPTIGGLVDDAFTSLGVAKTWTEVVAPVLRVIGERWAEHDDRQAMVAEWALATTASAAIDRYAAPAAALPGSAPVLFVCGPTERHELPVKMLSAALSDDGAAAAFLSGPVSVDVLRAMSARFTPRDVVVWSMTAQSADVRFLRVLSAEGVPVRPAGPGWHGLPTVGEPLPPSFAAALGVYSS